MKWLEESIMAKRGVGAGRKPVTHHLTEEMQKSFITPLALIPHPS